MDVTRSQVHAFRLRRHHLDRPASRADLVAVVRDTCGVQAQVPSAAALALRARVRGLRPEDVRRALEEDRSLARGWTVRYAIHLIPAEDFLLYARALAGRVRRSLGWFARHKASVEEVEAMILAIADALEDGPLTRRGLADRVVARFGEGARRRVEHSWGGLVVDAGLRGLVCFGPDRGNGITFASRRRWLPDVQEYAEDEAGAILLRRYLRAFGPATRQDFQRWAEVPMADVDRMWAVVAEGIVEVRTGGRAGWACREDLRALRARPSAVPVVRLLPSFDPYLLGHRDKSHLVDAAHYKRVYRKAGWLSPVVLVGGRCAGVWSYRKAGDRIDLRVQPFGRLSQATRDGIAAEADDIGRFLGGDVGVQYAKPS